MDEHRGSDSPQLTRYAGTFKPMPGGSDRRQLEVNVVYTTHSGTLAALKMASRLGANLGLRPNVLMVYSVPYTLPLERPAVPTEFLEERLRALAREFPVDFSARVILCRDSLRSLVQMLQPRSLMVIGGVRRWWATKEQRMARSLRKKGHQVIFAELR